MPRFTFKVKGEFLAVDAWDLEDAREQAGLSGSEEYELVKTDEVDDIRVLAAITDDDILFGL